jgi:hypothetical protein
MPAVTFDRASDARPDLYASDQSASISRGESLATSTVTTQGAVMRNLLLTALLALGLGARPPSKPAPPSTTHPAMPDLPRRFWWSASPIGGARARQRDWSTRAS